MASNSNIGISVDISISDCYGSIPGATETDMSTYRGRDKRTLSESITLSLPAVIGEKGAGEHDGSGVEAAERYEYKTYVSQYSASLLEVLSYFG